MMKPILSIISNKEYQSLKAILNIWKTLKLSLKGKLTVPNNLALAPIIYASSIVFVVVVFV